MHAPPSKPILARRPVGSLAATLALVAALAGGLLGGSPPAAAGEGERLLPDLITLQPSGLSIETLENRVRLRLGNTVANRGVGPLEVHGDVDPGVDCDSSGSADDDVTAFQRVFADGDGNGVFDRESDDQASETEVGCRVWHAAHSHWHFQDFATYRLKRRREGRSVASSTKVSFCVLDGLERFPGLAGSPPASYYPTGGYGCDEVSDQGLSVGWADVYGAALPGQHINITGLDAGVYCLVSIADPRNRLEELDDSNNTRRVTIRLRPDKDVVEPLHGGCA